MTNGTKENALRKQGENLPIIQRNNLNLKIATQQPLRGISAYERLRNEWIAANPVHNEAELLAACVVFARACGLILRERVLQQHMWEVGSYDTE